MKRYRIWALATMFVGLAGTWQTASLWAQSPADPSARAPSTGANYQVIPYSHNSAVMIDLQTGKTWKLERDAENSGHFVWVPIRKLETNMELDDWEQRMKKFKAERRKRREAEFGAAAPPWDIEPIPVHLPQKGFDFDLEP